MEDKIGYIYVLTNPSFPEYVKIGYADNVDARVAQLNRSECTPFAFKKYAVLPVASRLADKNIHKLIDRFKPELRAKENVNGKIRIREFFAMSAQEAVEILDTIGGIYGETPWLFEQTSEEQQDQEIAEKAAIASERKSPFSFYKCGIQDGEQIIYVHDSNIVCTVASDREILFDNKKTSLSALAKKLLNRKCGVQGTLYFTYKGELLSALRKRLEDEGKYMTSTAQDTVSSIHENCTPKSNGTILYFKMDKYPAACLWNRNGYLLLKGSRISLVFTNSCQNWIKELRKKYSNKIDANGILLEDIQFKSSSSVAMFVSGSSKNGKKYWKNEEGTLLQDLLNEGE
ncbi:MAG TPA: DUF4357 domain-containing protein [Candidatus Faecicola pullistercoris]|nr:DUF4357 domain-containing protein [Candidatus Faecicola pullistercoris]